MTSLTFYGGVSEIGGNKILLEDGDVRLFLDFGKNFEKERQYFDEPYLKPRDEKHLLALGLMPEREGLYKKDTEKEADIDAFLLSHPHTDHMDYLRYVKDDIPIYCSGVAKDIIISREFSGSGPAIEYKIAKLTKRDGEEVFKDIRSLKEDKKKDIGGIEVESFEVDHSTLGAVGYLIHTSEGTIAYTGDFRLHGVRADKSKEFILKAKECKPDALIIEGTNITGGKLSSEDEVLTKVGEVIGHTSRLVLANFSQIDIDRLNTFYTATVNNGRRLCISMKQAFLLDNIERIEGISKVDLKDENVHIFAKEKKSHSEWENRILNMYSDSILRSTDINKIQNEVVLVSSYYDMNEMVEIKPEAGSTYVVSQSEPFNEEMEIDYGKFLNWLNLLGLPLYNVHASGHAMPHQLKQAISEISPKKLFLIHTERPGLYSRYLGDLDLENITSPKVGEEYTL